VVDDLAVAAPPEHVPNDALTFGPGGLTMSRVEGRSCVSTYMLVFRIIHILGAIAWAGSVFFNVVFIQPTAKTVGPAAGPFMRELLSTRRLIDWILRLAGITIVSGAFLYWHDWEVTGSLGDFLGTSFGLWLTIGAIAALVAVGIGAFATRPTMARSLEVGGRIAQAGDQPPPPELVQELQTLQARGRTLSKWNLLFIGIAAFAMSTARYW
jgi:hypothetical protein